METQAPRQDFQDVQDLLAGPSPTTCTSQLIDFSKTNLKAQSGSFALLIHNLLTPEECADFLSAAQATTNGQWEQAMINIGGGRQMLATDTRHCGRIIWDHRELASRLENRILPHLPENIIGLAPGSAVAGWQPRGRKVTWRMTRLNDRLRFLKYTSGMYFRPHYDGSYVTPDDREVSYLTIHIYLNGNPVDARAEKAVVIDSAIAKDDMALVGGATRFFSERTAAYLDVVPTTGSCLVFQHEGLLHSGEDVIQGTKYTMRTDVMYSRDT